MKLIIGQGNPGKQYSKTRHNIGFLMIDNFAKSQMAKWQDKPKWQAEIAKLTINGEKALLVKPMCFYNLIGQVVQQISSYYQIDTSEDLLVICDDLALDFGTIRVRKQGSDGGNNGLKSIISHTGQEFWRIRIGTKNNLTTKIDNADFVLSKMSLRERQMLKNTSKTVDELIQKFVNKTISETSIN